jgi:serine protease
LGIAPDASIISIRVLGLCGAGYTADVTDAIVWAVGGVINGVPTNPNPAKIIDLSLEGDGLCSSFLQSAINQAHDSGALVYAAAGNDAFDTIANIYPANCKNVVSVGASTKNGTLAPYSNKGANVLAPGGDDDDPIYVLSVFDGVLSGALTVGTSMAVAHVAGLAALNIVTANCPSPSYAITPGASSGCKCPKGTYGRVTNATHAECIICPLGQYCPAASVACAC